MAKKRRSAPGRITGGRLRLLAPGRPVTRALLCSAAAWAATRVAQRLLRPGG
jgi:hypothetical protein